MTACIAVGLGGFIGSILRYLIGLIPVGSGNFPLKTFLINIIGCFAIGIIAAIASKNPGINSNIVLFFKTGICGGFTTFSTFALETKDLAFGGNGWIATIYAILSVAIGFVMVYLAQALVNRF